MNQIFSLTFILCLLSASLWDLKTLRIPNLLSLGGFVLLLILRWIEGGLFPGEFLIQGLICSTIMIFFFALSRGKMGMGDAKLSLSIGGTLGLQSWLYSLTAASFSALLAALLLIRFRKMDRKSPIPFAPFLAFGGILFYWISPEDLFAL